MSYILDALKKSDRERQQGNAPSLYTLHGPAPSLRNSSRLKQYHIILLIFGMLILLFICFGLLFFQYRHFFVEKPQTIATETALSSAKPQAAQPTTTAQPLDRVVMPSETPAARPSAIDNNKTTLSVAVKQDTKEDISTPSTVIEPEPLRKPLPYLQDLSPALQAQIPSLKFAGHTFAENSSQRMIIVNGTILKEGATIAPKTRLVEITWDGVTVEYDGTRFQVQTH
ncbi:MAG: general secretion pathway protein GspB, partial [Desulforhopalus sp.]